jgi:hypothetical protein
MSGRQSQATDFAAGKIELTPASPTVPLSLAQEKPLVQEMRDPSRQVKDP